MSDATTATGTAADPILDLVKYQKDQAAKKTASTTTPTSSTLGKDDFMQLLVTQLRYQDPLSPQDNQQMAAQMAQFSSLESLQNVQKSIEALGTTFTEMAGKQSDAADAVSSGSATSMLGKIARFQVDEIERPATGSASKLPVHADAGSVVVISDSDGKAIRTIQLAGSLVDGEGTLSWDGKDDDGNFAASGTYKVAIQDAATGKKSGYIYEDAAVVGVSFDDDGPVLRSATGSYKLSNLVEIGADAASMANTADNGAATSAALALIGKTVRVRDAGAELGPDGAEWTFTAAEGSVGQILNSDGEVVKTFSVNGTDSNGDDIMDSKKGSGALHWNGDLASGESAKEGTYYLRIVDPTGKSTTGTTFREVKVESLAFDIAGTPKLVSGKDIWSLSDLFTI